MSDNWWETNGLGWIIIQYMVTWHAHIHSDPAIVAGKPVVKGTRLAVDFILGLFASGWTEAQVLKNYPTLSPEALRAVFAFASECLKEEAIYDFNDALSG